MARTILVGAGPGTAGRDALALGVRLAGPLNATLTLAGVTAPPGHRPTAPSRAPAAVAGALGRLRRLAPPEIPVAVRIVPARSVIDGLRDLAVDLEAELIVLGPTHRGAIERVLRADVSDELLFDGTCGLAVAVRGQAATPPRRIGVAWNATPEADAALAWALGLAERAGGAVRITSVLEPRHRPGSAGARAALAQLEALCRACEDRVPSEAQLIRGDAATLLASAGADQDLLVLGSRTDAPGAPMAFGSVSRQVLHAAGCPTVVLPGDMRSRARARAGSPAAA